MITLQDVIDCLALAERFGEAKDEPEGARILRISDTLALQMADCLKKVKALIEELQKT